MTEEWRPVPGFENYLINIDTKEGRCKNKKTGRVKSNTPDKWHRRIYWGLRNNGRHRVQQAARWIAITYPELTQNKWFEGAQIDHIDTDRLNNHPSNLRWVTPKENQNNPLSKSHHSNSIFINGCKKCVAQMDLFGNPIQIFKSIRDANRVTGVNANNIARVCKGEKYRHTAGGFIWKYI